MDKVIDFPPGSQRTRYYITKVLPCMGLVVLLLGIFMFGAAIGVLVQEEYHAAVSSVPFQAASIVLLIAGILSVAAGGLLIYVTKFTDASPPLVVKRSLWFIGILSFAALFAFIAAILGFVYIGKVDNKMQDDLEIKVKEYGRKFDSLASVDNVQSKDECCGVHTYADWRATVYGGHRYDRVPDTCCKEYKYGCGFKFSDEATLNKRGCVEVIKSGIRKHLLIVGISGILIAIIKVVSAIEVWYIRKKYLT